VRNMERSRRFADYATVVAICAAIVVAVVVLFRALGLSWPLLGAAALIVVVGLLSLTAERFPSRGLQQVKGPASSEAGSSAIAGSSEAASGAMAQSRNLIRPSLIGIGIVCLAGLSIGFGWKYVQELWPRISEDSFQSGLVASFVVASSVFLVTRLTTLSLRLYMERTRHIAALRALEMHASHVAVTEKGLEVDFASEGTLNREHSQEAGAEAASSSEQGVREGQRPQQGA
jgi:uncharacterized membrane protein